VVLAVDRAGLVGQDGPTHHGVFDLAYLRSIPNLTLMVPRDQLMLASMLEAGLALNRPAVLRYPRARTVERPARAGALRHGRCEVLRPGTNAAVFCAGPLCYTALEALGDMGGVAVVDLVYAKPLDSSALRGLVSACGGRFVTVEDGCVQGGVGSAILESLADLGTPLKFRMLGIPDSFIEHGTVEELRGMVGLDAAGIRRAVEEVL